MSSKHAQLSTSSVVLRRPLTKLALDNKIRAMLSQFHPRERHFAPLSFDHTIDRVSTCMEPIHPMEKECLKSKLSFSVINSSMMMKDKIKIDDFSLMNKQTDEYINTYKKVTEWLEYFNDDDEQKKESNTI